MGQKQKPTDTTDRALPAPQLSPEASPSHGKSDANGTQKPAHRESLAGWLQNPSILLLVLGLLTLILYIGTLSFPFVSDDYFQVANNLLIRSWHNVPRVFGSDMWVNFTNSRQPYYRPLFTMWSMLNYSAFQLNTWGWHLGVVLLHIFAAVSVFLLARKLGLEYWTAGLAAMFFAFHPAHVECTACVSAGSDPMVTAFFALAFVAFLNGREPTAPNRLAWRLASLAFLACGLLTKEMALTLVAIVALYAWMFPLPQASSFAGRLRQSLLSALPYAVVTVAYLLLRKSVLHQVTAPLDRSHLVAMVLTWPEVLYHYVRMLVFPVGLTFLYYDPYVDKPGLANFVFPLLVVAAVILGIWYWARRTGDRAVAFAGLWMIVTLAPALYLPSFKNGDFVHDRYIYLPSVGFAILLAKLVRLLPGIKSARPVAVQVAATCVLALAYIAGSYYAQVYWGSNLLLFYRGHTLYPNYEFATVSYADELGRRGGYERAIALLKPVVQSHPDNDPSAFMPYFSLAETYIRAGDLTNGRATLAKAAALSGSTEAPAENTVFVARRYGELGDFDRALELCSDALQKDAKLYSALHVCGNIQFLAGHYPEAEKLLTQAVAVAPERAAPRFLLGRVYLQTGHPTEAEAAFAKAVQLDATVYDYHFWYARTLMLRGDVADARREFLAALAINPDGREAKAALASLPASQ